MIAQNLVLESDVGELRLELDYKVIERKTGWWEVDFWEVISVTRIGIRGGLVWFESWDWWEVWEYWSAGVGAGTI